eukprot:TRINITY_DN19331_c0_g1_i1.p1 TRINITY_DN19331_c0_g1~~TRINITY_DN19331_c0_g1_i1.p1  ORF type:complete len:721 (+),score=117.51 TRINITY_DN19331_c0_g1_i1:94-2163(+)
MRIGDNVRTNFRALLSDYNVASPLRDRDIDGLCRHLRKTLKDADASDLAGETRVAVAALSPIRDELLSSAETAGLDSDQWSDLLWNVWRVFVENTKAAEKLRDLHDDSAAWSDMITILLAECSETETLAGPWWAKRLVVYMWLSLLSGALWFLSSFGWTGRTRVTLVFIGILCWPLAFLWKRFGWDLGKSTRRSKPKVSFREDDADSICMSTASSQIRRENEELRRQLQSLESAASVAPPLPPPPGAPPLPSGASGHPKSALTRALTDLASGADEGPMFIEEAALAVEMQASVHSGIAFTGIGSPGKLVNLAVGEDLSGLTGVAASDKDNRGRFEFLLLDGRKLGRLTEQNVQWLSKDEISEELLNLVTSTLGIAVCDSPVFVQPDAEEEGGEFHAPLSEGAKARVGAEAKKVRDALDKWSARASFLGAWPKAFWSEVDAMKIEGAQLRVILRSHGHTGPGSSAAPRADELRKQLKEFEQKGYCGPGAKAELLEDLEAAALHEDYDNWGNVLPDTLQRAAPEIYRNLIGGNGRKSLRDIIDDYFPIHVRGKSAEYLELFNIATTIDFLAQRHKHNAAHLMQTLASDDVAEIGLRRIASWLHAKRTGDEAAASSMLAVQPRGQYANAAPQWLLEQSQAFSQAEFKTRERVRAAGKPSKPSGNQEGKAGGKGTKGKKGKASSGGAAKDKNS